MEQMLDAAADVAAAANAADDAAEPLANAAEPTTDTIIRDAISPP